MKYKLLYLFILITGITFSQTKISGHVFDENNEPVAFANVIFKGSIIGTTTNENGRFYLESDKNWKEVKISFVGYQTLEVALEKRISYDLKFTLKEDVAQLNQVVIVSGKQPKKNNPAIDILRKIWANKRKNGLKQFKQYQYDKYEKVEFDLNTIDSALIKSRLFRGMEFVFDQVDTSSVTGKTYLPMFINEAASEVFGDNILNKEKEVIKGNKNSGFSDDQIIIDFVDDLYADFNVYDNYLKFFDKSFVSPLSRTGINTYNYVLSDSTYIDDKWCYNIIYYPRRKNELTFKGDFWVNDSTYAIKEINLQATKSANINWVKEIYIEQEYEVLNDSLFLIKRDYMLSDFALSKKEKSRGIYGKRTTLYDNYQFDKELENPKFYDKVVYEYDKDVYHRGDEFWEANRLEKLNNDEKGVYKMLDTLKTVKKFKRLYNLGSILASGYIEFPSLNLDYGPIFSTVGFNEVEGFRLRAGARTYFGSNDLWRLEGFTAYGFRDNKFKYGISGKWLLDKKSRLIISGGNRRDVEQIGASLTTSTDVLGRNLASSSIVSTGANDRLTNINLSTLAIEAEPFRNFIVRLGGSYRTLESASPTFSLDYNDPDSPTGISSEVKQYETSLSLFYFPGRKTTGFGVERLDANDGFSRLFAQVSRGDKSILNSDFDFTKVQFSYTQPWQLGGFGRLTSSLEAGKTFGEVPLGLLSVVPGNQSLFSIYNTFSQLDFYEFVTDTYTSLHLEHNFNGRLFSRIPFLRKLNLREIVSIRGVWGELSDENIALSTTSNPNSILLQAPDDEIYWEYSLGVGNIFKIFRLDFNFRGNYLDNPGARRFGVTGTFGFHF
ncbi:carboxypeptidase-like regulatory domain-containing protein [Flavobacteriaceae bacterium AU392]|nr:carboxypeptidase-like regulatory domain-containing protein [Flavobacteriaceae bacterium]RKM81567.1 carboxypeptidase-like regulatory domain-containing protein [Flavobacteriaceae bacterium AU392]